MSPSTSINFSTFRDDRSSTPRPTQATEELLQTGIAWSIALASVSVLTATLAGRWWSSLSDQWGMASEELFRGDRLPLLNPPTANPTANPTADPAPFPAPESLQL